MQQINSELETLNFSQMLYINNVYLFNTASLSADLWMAQAMEIFDIDVVCRHVWLLLNMANSSILNETRAHINYLHVLLKICLIR